MTKKLYGQIAPIRLYGRLNTVPSDGNTGGPLQHKVVFPSHEEQTISPDDDFYGLSLVVVKPVPRVPAAAVSITATGSAAVIEVPVNISVAVSVTAEDYVV